MKLLTLFIAILLAAFSFQSIATTAVTAEGLPIKVKIIGVINDEKFTVEGKGNIDPKSGDAQIELHYSNVPDGWNIMNYSDPLVLLAGYGESKGGRNFGSLSTGYEAKATYDFGNGLMLRKTATIRIGTDGLDAVYSITGTARVADIVKANPYKEHLVPTRDGFIAIGLASWTTKCGGTIEALVSTRYRLKGINKAMWRAVGPQVRSFTVDATVSNDGRTFTGRFKTSVTGGAK